jgi:hypothetical protein
MSSRRGDSKRPSSVHCARSRGSDRSEQSREAWEDEDVRCSQRDDGRLSSEESIMHAIQVMRSKYSQNIDVIGMSGCLLVCC